MARRAMTPEMYDAMCQAFLLKPGNAANAARASGCDPRMARRGWKIGWIDTSPSYRPINEVVAEKQEEARTVALEREAEEKSHTEAERKLRADAAQSVREDEAMLVSLARSDTIALLGGIGLMAEGLQHLGEKLAEALLKLKVVDPKATISLYKGMASAIRSGALSAKAVVELERLVAGDPSKVLGSTPDSNPDSLREAFLDKTNVELAAEIERASAALARARRRGLVLVEGGKDEAADDDAAKVG